MLKISWTANASVTFLTGLLAAISLPLQSQEDPHSPAPTVLAVVNGEKVLTESVERTLSRSHQTAIASESVGMDVDRLMFKVVNDILLAQEARAMGMNEEEAVANEVSEYRRDLAKRKLEFEEITSRAKSTDEEIKAYFNRRYRRVTFRVVTAYERADAEKLFRRLQDGADMATVAKQESVDPYRLRSGLVKDIESIDLQLSIAKLVFSLEPGQLAGPVQTDLGWSIVRTESIESPTEQRFSEVEKKVRAIVRMEKARIAKREFAANLRVDYHVEIDKEVVGAIQPELRPDGRLVPSIPEPEAAVATLDGADIIPAANYGHALLSRWAGIRNIDAARAAAPIVLARLIDNELVFKEAIRRGYDRLPEINQAVYAFESDLLVSKYLEEVVAARVEVQQEEMKAYYDEHQQQLHRPPRVRLSQITVATQEEAMRIANDLRGGADAGWLAKQHSIDRFKESGGDRGWYEPQPEVPDFNADLFEAEVNSVLEPFGVPGNWVILKVTGREDQGIYEYDQVAGNIRDKVFAENLRQELDKLITTLRDRSEIEIDLERLSELQITGSQAKDSERGDGLGHGQ